MNTPAVVRAQALCLAMFAAALSCRTATQIEVTVKGRGFACTAQVSDENPYWLAQVGVIAEPVIDASTVLQAGSGAIGKGSDSEVCSGDAGGLGLGSVVLVPGAETGNVEILTVAALNATYADGSGVSTQTLDICLAEYSAYLASAATSEKRCTEEQACALCIYARRSLGFVEHSKLELEIELATECAGVLCPNGQTCEFGECASAQVTCQDTNTCKEEGGAGGGGGSNGEGGSGGGQQNPLWTRLTLGDCGALCIPADVVGDPATGRLFVAANTHMFVLDDGMVTSVAKPNGAFRAVSDIDPETNGVATIGRDGVATWPDFEPEPPPPGPGLPMDWPVNGSSASFDVAVRQSVEPISSGSTIEWVFTDGPATAEASFGAGSPSGGALFSLHGPPAGIAPGPAATFLRGGTSMSVTGGLADAALTGLDAVKGASLWGTTQGSGENWALISCDRLDRRLEIFTFNPALGQFVGTEPVVRTWETAMSGSSDVRAIWGEQTDGGLRLWAVGLRDSGPWLGSTIVDLDVQNETTVTWDDHAIPDEAAGSQAFASIWVGADGAGANRVVIAGNAGVFEADRDELEASTP